MPLDIYWDSDFKVRSVIPQFIDAVGLSSPLNFAAGPYILEMETYRYRGHSMSDPANYRSKEEVDKVRDEQDPITNLRDQLIAAKIFTEDDAKAMDREVRAIVTEAAEFAQTSPEPDPSELYTDVLVDA